MSYSDAVFASLSGGAFGLQRPARTELSFYKLQDLRAGSTNTANKVAIVSYGAVGQGALTCLRELGYHNVTVYSRRSTNQLKNKQLGVLYKQFNGAEVGKALLGADIVVNALRQDLLNPINFFSAAALEGLPSKLIIDISCDEQIGFDFASATSMAEPIRKVGAHYYYAVDNIPSLAYEKASLHLSKQLRPLLDVMMGKGGLEENSVLRGA